MAPAHVVRNNRRTRWFHAGVACLTLVLLGTGWWLQTGHEGQPSLLARLLDAPDTEIHRRVGWALAALAVLPVTVGVRAAVTFGRETLRLDPGDGRWLRRWPAGAVTGRFAAHRGHFDPGQRLANIAFVATLTTLVVTGVGLTTVHGGPDFVWLVRVHRLATYALTPLAIGHVLLAVGVLPGYRGAWRAMHLGGRVPAATARRLWHLAPAPDPTAAVRAEPRGEEGSSEPRSKEPSTWL
jgi:cytochrome b subunit of formate dehydrogenase